MGVIIMTMATYEQILRLTRGLNLPEQLQLLEALSRMVRHQMESTEPENIMDLEGLGADIWTGIDAQEYINQERASWDS